MILASPWCEGNVLLFSNGQFIRMLAVRWTDIETSTNAGHLMLPTASLNALGQEGSISRLRLWNDTHSVAA